MASNTAQTVFTGNASQLEAEYKKIDAARERDIAKLKKQLEESKRAANEEIKLKHDIARAIEAARTPAEKYNQTLAKYKQALEQGKITQEQFNRLRDVELSQLNKATKATDALTEAKTKQQAATASSASAMGSWTGSLSRSAASVAVLIAAVNQLAEAKRKLRKENEPDVFSIDKASRSYAVQVGLTTDAERIAARDRILKTGRDNAVLPQQAFAAATALQGAGITDERALDFFLKMRAASNETDSDPQELAIGMAQFLGAMGQEKSFKNFEDLGQRMRGMFGNEMSAAVQVQHLSDFTTAAPAFAMTDTSTRDGLAMLAVMTGAQKSSSVAATGTSAIVTTLAAGMGGEALKKMGLKTTDVDMVGETLFDALDRIKKATDKMPKEERQAALGKLFGKEQIDAGLIAINSVDAMRKIAESQVNREAFDAGVAMATTGVSADMRRAEADKAITAIQFEDQIARKAVIDKTVEDFRLERQMKRSGLTGSLKTMAETGVDLPILGNIGLDSLDDNAAETGIISDEERLQRAANEWDARQLPFVRQFYPSVKNTFQDPAKEAQAQKAINGNDPQMMEQNQILRDLGRDLGQKLDKLAPAPGVRPNPATVGRPDQ